MYQVQAVIFTILLKACNVIVRVLDILSVPAINNQTLTFVFWGLFFQKKGFHIINQTEIQIFPIDLSSGRHIL